MLGFRERNLEHLSVDHRVEVSALTGTARLSIPIRTSPGRESFGPSLALGYASGGRNSAFGVGWFLSGVPSIGLDTTRGLPRYDGAEDTYAYAGGQRLLPTLRAEAGGWRPVIEERQAFSVQRFRNETERSFERFERWTHRETARVHWIVRARNGVVSVFGQAADGSTRIADPRDPDRRTYQWLLEAQYHPKGNAIVYQYKPEDGSRIDSELSFEARRPMSGGFAQRYLKRIRYGNSRPLSLARPDDDANEWRFEVVFDYGEHGVGATPTYADDTVGSPAWGVRSDAFSTYRPGFELRTYRLCRRVLMFHTFPELDGGAPHLVGATELTHDPDPAGAVLESITYRGYRRDEDGSTSERAVPALRLTYSDHAVGAAFEAPEAAENLPSGLDGAVYQWMDLRNEGLPGVLSRQNGCWYFKENLGGGRFGPTTAVDEVPAAVSAAFQLHDFDGDGNLNFVSFEGREAGYYRHDRGAGRWEGFRSFHGLPRVDFHNARVQWVDLNGDGHADLVVERDDRLVWYPSEGADGFGAAVEIARPDVRAAGAPTLIQKASLRTFFADMTGDGLLDVVCVGSGRVEYWPNLGHGAFGAGVVMEGAPVLDDFGELDARRIRLVDIDGTGGADLIYIGSGEVRFWINQSGNRFGAEHRLANLPYIDNLSSAQVFDFLGDGTRCLVWSSPLASHEGQAIQYLRLTGELPPRLLLSVANGVGRETRLAYRSSAQEYLRAKNEERPWHTVLPRHSMVVHRMEGIDHISGGRMVTRYEYRDGYFDDRERRFVGFGLVDTFDVEKLASDTSPSEELTPPALVRSWYHTGASGGVHERARDFYAGDPLAARPPAPHIDAVDQLTTEEQLAAYRALAGLQWRQEFYGVRPDGQPEPLPHRTTELAYRVRRLQSATNEIDAVFALEQSEVLSHEYGHDPADPRVSHDLVLETDAFGNVSSRVAIAYPRRGVGPDVRPEQQALHAELTQRTHVNLEEPDRFEAGIETEVRRLSLTGLAPAAGLTFERDALITQIQSALSNPLAFHDPPTRGGPQARLIGVRRNRFWDDERDAATVAGDVGAVTLLHHVERAILPEVSIDALYDGRVDGLLLSGDGHYHRDDGFWWADDTTYHYAGAAEFFRLREERSPGGGRRTLSFDPHHLLVTAVADALGNRVQSTPDYQTLAASRVQDANANVSEVRYDALGVPFVTSLRGTQLGRDGVAHPVGDEDLAAYVPVAGATLADVLARPESLLQGASRYFFYDLEAFQRGEGPPRSVHVERERHRHDGEGAAPSTSAARVTVRYVDGFGRAVQTKVRADGGLAIQRSSGEVVVDGDGRPVPAEASVRWLTSGHHVYNNKGWVVRKYEAFFSTSADFESDEALQNYGVSTRTRYDAIGRVLRQDLPDGTFTTSAYTPWESRQADANDNVVGSDYEAERQALPETDPQWRALDRARAHADTPTIVENDPLGRAFRLRETGAGGLERVTTTTYGAFGLAERVVDPRGLTAFSYRYDMLGRAILERSMDAGDRWTLWDARGNPVHQWDGRGVHTHRSYDANGRHVQTRVLGGVDPDGVVLDNIVEQVTYGDDPAVSDAELKNARGRAVLRRDDAGSVVVERYHMDGQAIDVTRSIRVDYKRTVDWTDPAAVPMASSAHRTETRVDAFGRVTWQRLPDGTTREYGYALLGHVREIRLTTDDGALERHVIASDIETNARGQRTRVVLGNGVETSYEYDPATFRLERLYTRRVLGPARDYLDVEYTHDPVGNITRWSDRVQGPGAAMPLLQGLTVSAACEFEYDAFYQLKEATGRVHQGLLPHDYRAGTSGDNPIKGTRHLHLNNGAAIERYTRSYEYDLGGNLVRTRHQGLSRSWTNELWTSPSSNRSLPRTDLNGIDIVDPESRFDANGNTAALPHLRAVDWNYANRLARAVVIDRSSSGQPDDAEYYVYGADGVRVRRVTERLVAGALEVTETTYLEGCEIRSLTHGGNTRLLRRTSHITDGSARLATLHQWSVDHSARETDDIGAKKLHYLAGNHLGSVSLELDEAGEVISYEEYFPFGGTSFLAGKSARDVKLKEYRYSGKCRDDATGLYYYEYRYYAPFIGNWLSPDPIGPADGLNLYRFVHNNPIRFVDPDGLQATGLEVRHRSVAALPPEVQAKLDADPALRQRFASHEVYFIPDGDGGYQAVTQAQAEEFIRLQNQAGNVPNLITVGAPGDDDGSGDGGVEDPEFQQLLRTLEEILAPISGSSSPAGFGDGAGGGGGTATEDAGAGDSGAGRDGQGAHPADGSSGLGGTTSGRTGESGSNGSATTGDGSGAGPRGSGRGGGGAGEVAGRGDQGRGDGAGAGHGDGSGAGSPGAEARAGGSRRGEGGSGNRNGNGKRNGGGANAGSRAGRSSGTDSGGTVGAPPPPPGAPVGPDGIPFSPDMKLPEVMPEAGTPVTDPSQVRVGSPTGDPRGEPGADAGSAGRPDGTEGGGAGGTSTGGSPTGSAGSQGEGQEGGQPGGGQGLRGGVGDHELPSWLSWIDTGLDWLQVGLDVVGLIPGLGEIADGINGLISLARGDYAGAALSFAAMIPFAGWFATAGKFGRRAVDAVDAVSDVTGAVSRYGDEAASAVNAGARHADEGATAIREASDVAAARESREAFYSVQSPADVERLLERGGVPWPSGVTNGSLRDIFGQGLYTFASRDQAERYLGLLTGHGAEGLRILRHEIAEGHLKALRAADLTRMSDDAANAILDMGANHGFERIVRMTGNFGVENFFRSDVFHLFSNSVVK